MLTEGEKQGMSELLHDMEPPDLISLAKTVTLRLVETNSAVQALDNILLHADSAEGVLMRRKVTKELLFKHLNSKRVPIRPREDKARCHYHAVALQLQQN